MRVVLATHNPHKVTELQRILGPALAGIELVTYDGPSPVEDGASFAENALIKARAAAAHTGLPALADDSGICVDALGGEPGIDSAHYSGARDDAANLARLLEHLGAAADRAAHFTCAAALVIPGPPEREFVELGVWPGTVLHEATGPNGFGYDPVFKPAGFSVSAAELRPDEKNAISHRALAFRELMPTVRRELLGE
ncbi:MAG: RdgB/HAM1 family non-canonical purine NTP pyrophosphatase [Rhodoglobus sp.]